MNIFAISDLHLSFRTNPDPPGWQAEEYKPMSEIDSGWTNHARRIYENWLNTVDDGDLVLMPGDLSWAMKLEEAAPDLFFLGLLPGKIVMVQGNHDYWWQSISRVREKAPPNVALIQNDCFFYDRLAICGTRGWTCPNDNSFTEHDQKLYNRELIRLEYSLRCASGRADRIIAMIHFMPVNEKKERSGFIDLFQKYGVDTVVYGHLHSRSCRSRLPERAWGINFHLVSADFLNYTPALIGVW